MKVFQLLIPGDSEAFTLVVVVVVVVVAVVAVVAVGGDVDDEWYILILMHWQRD